MTDRAFGFDCRVSMSSGLCETVLARKHKDLIRPLTVRRLIEYRISRTYLLVEARLSSVAWPCMDVDCLSQVLTVLRATSVGCMSVAEASVPLHRQTGRK